MRDCLLVILIIFSVFCLCMYLDYVPEKDKQTCRVVGKRFVPAGEVRGKCFDVWDICIERVRGKPYKRVIEVNLDMDFWSRVKIGDTLRTKY